MILCVHGVHGKCVDVMDVNALGTFNVELEKTHFLREAMRASARFLRWGVRSTVTHSLTSAAN